MKTLLFLILLSANAFADVTYKKDIYPIFKNRCSQCHNEYWADHNWLDYSVAYQNRDKIRERVYVRRDMPLASSMPDEERNLIKQWVDEGAKNSSKEGEFIF